MLRKTLMLFGLVVIPMIVGWIAFWIIGFPSMEIKLINLIFCWAIGMGFITLITMALGVVVEFIIDRDF